MSLSDQPRVFVYVIGGVADFKADPDADVCVVDGDNLATDPQYTPTVPARFADLAKHFDIPVTDEGAQPATAPQATSDAQQLRTLCLSLLSMLTDLNKGYLRRGAGGAGQALRGDCQVSDLRSSCGLPGLHPGFYGQAGPVAHATRVPARDRA